MHQKGYHHENSMVSQIRAYINDQLESRNNEVLSVLHSMFSLTSSSFDSENSQDTLTHYANSATIDMVQLEILKILKQIQFDTKQTSQSYIPIDPINTLSYAPSSTRWDFSKTTETQKLSPRKNRPNYL